MRKKDIIESIIVLGATIICMIIVFYFILEPAIIGMSNAGNSTTCDNFWRCIK